MHPEQPTQRERLLHGQFANSFQFDRLALQDAQACRRAGAVQPGAVLEMSAFAAEEHAQND